MAKDPCDDQRDQGRDDHDHRHRQSGLQIPGLHFEEDRCRQDFGPQPGRTGEDQDGAEFAQGAAPDRSKIGDAFNKAKSIVGA